VARREARLPKIVRWHLGIRPRNPYRLTLASFGDFRLLGVRNLYTLTLASFGGIRLLIVRPRNPYSFTLASFGNFRLLVVSPRNPYILTLASFVSFRAGRAHAQPRQPHVDASFVNFRVPIIELILTMRLAGFVNRNSKPRRRSSAEARNTSFLPTAHD
jgi:hypothetical protein